ncbi:MAG: N-carbamoylputrescine amidase [Gammaproteobacteria bacterium]|nr:N-carbamoylputrescine amidase [Gammaproteobacteria bacterium]
MTITVAATQMACTWNRDENLRIAEDMVREAAGSGANIILLQELFETPYFCKDEAESFFDLATPVSDNAAVRWASSLAAELGVVLPVSVFERSNNALYNSMVMIGADGSVLGTYRKTHIPDGPGYSEKYYFNPGDTGFVVWKTRFGNIGTLICWDQWFPEAARILTLKGAELILYPTAIGSWPDSEDTEALSHWQTVMQGHAAANIVPVVASNRIGVEQGESHNLRFFGSSFVCDHRGQMLQTASEDKQEILVQELDLKAATQYRLRWNLFRDRRPEMYREIMTLDGKQPGAAVRL